MAVSNPLATAVPILFLVILKLCDVSRGLNDYTSYGENNISTLYDKVSNMEPRPFLFIHMVNFFILAFLFVGAVTSIESSILRVFMYGENATTEMLLSFITLFLWLILPILEISDYWGYWTKESTIPDSLLKYWIGTFITAIAISVQAYMQSEHLSEFINLNPLNLSKALQFYIDDPIILLYQIVFLTAMSSGAYFSVISFTSELDKEVSLKSRSEAPPYIN